MADRRTRRRFTREYKAQAVQRVIESGLPLADIAAELDVSPGQLSQWRNEQLAAGSAEVLTHQAPHLMGDEGRMAPIAKARGEPVNEPDGLIGRAEKQSAGLRSHAPAGERGHEFAAPPPSERHPGRATLCGHRG